MLRRAGILIISSTFHNDNCIRGSKFHMICYQGVYTLFDTGTHRGLRTLTGSCCRPHTPPGPRRGGSEARRPLGLGSGHGGHGGDDCKHIDNVVLSQDSHKCFTTLKKMYVLT